MPNKPVFDILIFDIFDMNELKDLNELILLVYLLSGKDVSEEWQRKLQDDLRSIEPAQIMKLWQSLLQLNENRFVSVLFQFVQPNKPSAGVTTKVVLITREDDQLLLCNGIGSESFLLMSAEEVVDVLDWWVNQPDCDIPMANVHPLYQKVFQWPLGIKSVHLFTNTHEIQDNTNLRLAHFQTLCESSKCKTKNVPIGFL